MFFASLVVEREPTKWTDLPAGLLIWLNEVGLLAAIILVIGLIFTAVMRLQKPAESPGGSREGPGLLAIAFPAVLAGIGYLIAMIGFLLGAEGAYLLTVGRIAGGTFSLLAVSLPFLIHLLRLRWRRIWALARVSFKEAVRRQIILAVLGIMVGGMLVAGWFLSGKPEDQVRSYVAFIFLLMAILVLVPSALLGSFGLPSDMTRQTIYTIVTKPVERFELYLGRFLGYALLMSMLLAVMTSFSLLFVVRGISPEAAEESWKARVPLFGDLTLEPRDANLSVGREWDYRKYIAGGDANHRAIWTYDRLPADLANRTDRVRCEFTFDIFRTTKGIENLGVLCTFEFRGGRCGPLEIAAYDKERTTLLDQRRGDPKAREQIENELAEKYGYFVVQHKEITDYHTESIAIPVGVFKRALEDDPLPSTDAPGQPGSRLRVVVRCESRTQYVGMARRDLYLLDAERSPYLNFFKGAAGLWLLVCMVLGVSIACSTQLSGVITFLVTAFLFVSGMFQEYVVSLAKGAVEGGGPAQHMVRMLRGVPSPTIPLESSAGKSLAESADILYQGLFGFLRMIVPDVNAYDLREYVAEGFDVALFNFGGDDLLVKAILLLGYLIPWGLGAFYMLKWREVAA